jgi:hypothetical protein
MNPHIRNTIALLLILTVANLAASFAALRAVRTVRDDSRAHIERVDDAITRLTVLTTKLCAQHGDVCAVQVSTSPGNH